MDGRSFCQLKAFSRRIFYEACVTLEFGARQRTPNQPPSKARVPRTRSRFPLPSPPPLHPPLPPSTLGVRRVFSRRYTHMVLPWLNRWDLDCTPRSGNSRCSSTRTPCGSLENKRKRSLYFDLASCSFADIYGARPANGELITPGKIARYQCKFIRHSIHFSVALFS